VARTILYRPMAFRWIYSIGTVVGSIFGRALQSPVPQMHDRQNTVLHSGRSCEGRTIACYRRRPEIRLRCTRTISRRRGEVLLKVCALPQSGHLCLRPISPSTFQSICRYALQLLTPASILANLSGRGEIEVDDISEMNELFLDAKSSAAVIGQGGFDGGTMW
jgi:hypothetical protein